MRCVHSSRRFVPMVFVQLILLSFNRYSKWTEWDCVVNLWIVVPQQKYTIDYANVNNLASQSLNKTQDEKLNQGSANKGFILATFKHENWRPVHMITNHATVNCMKWRFE